MSGFNFDDLCDLSNSASANYQRRQDEASMSDEQREAARRERSRNASLAAITGTDDEADDGNNPWDLLPPRRAPITDKVLL